MHFSDQHFIDSVIIKRLLTIGEHNRLTKPETSILKSNINIEWRYFYDELYRAYSYVRA